MRSIERYRHSSVGMGREEAVQAGLVGNLHAEVVTPPCWNRQFDSMDLLHSTHMNVQHYVKDQQVSNFPEEGVCATRSTSYGG